MEHVLREKAKAFWALRRTYEAIAKHNEVRLLCKYLISVEVSAPPLVVQFPDKRCTTSLFIISLN
jgi:hypothetical protein